MGGEQRDKRSMKPRSGGKGGGTSELPGFGFDEGTETHSKGTRNNRGGKRGGSVMKA